MYLFEKYGLYLFQMFLESVLFLIILKYPFLKCLFNLVTCFIGFIFQTGTLHNGQTQSLEYMWFVITPIFVFLRACLLRTLTKLSSKTA